jgi:hypothetical protein
VAGIDSEFKRIAYHVVIGGLIGYFILHPFIMVSGYLMMEKELLHVHGLLEIVRKSFAWSMLPSALAFTVLGAGAGYLNGKRQIQKIQLEEAYKKIGEYSTQLEQKVEERTKELRRMLRDLNEAHEKLTAAYEELKSLDELKANIIANVSHELRTPITICKGAIEIAMDEEDADKRRKLLHMAKEAMERENRIVGDLVAVAQMEKQRFRVNLENINIADVIAIVLEEFRGLAEEKKIALEMRVEKAVPPVKADFEKIRHVLRNLVDNAIKFNPEGGTVEVHASKRKDEVVVCVRDTGIGIPKDKLDKIFDRMYQVDASLTRRYGGTGMGLAVAKQIIELHKGRIWAKSEPGKGSEFCFTLPVST